MVAYCRRMRRALGSIGSTGRKMAVRCDESLRDCSLAMNRGKADVHPELQYHGA
jgi:hypothetical protein